MDFNLKLHTSKDGRTTYLISDLFAWFESNKEQLPKTLDCEYAYYPDVYNTFEICKYRIECEIDRLGSENIKQSKTALSSKTSIERLYNQLQNKEGWNKPKPEWKPFNNKNGIY